MSDELLNKFNPGFAPKDPPGDAIMLQWAGTAGFIISHGGSTILIDPYMTRSGLLHIPFSRLDVNRDLCALMFPKADAILVGHSHFDHLLDVPFIAELTGAQVIGSASTSTLCRAAGIPARQITEVVPRQPYEIGSAFASFFPSRHGLVLMGRVPFAGEITGTPVLPMRASGYKHGSVYVIVLNINGFRICHFGSANIIDSELEKIGKVDLLLLGISGRQKTPKYVERATAALKPKYLLPHHYDNFFKPFRAGRMPLRGVGLNEFFATCEKACPQSRLITPGFMQPVVFEPSSGALLTSTTSGAR